MGTIKDLLLSNSGMFDGSTASRAIPPVHVATLLEQMGAGPKSTATRICKAMADYCRDRDDPLHINYDQMKAILSQRRI